MTCFILLHSPLVGPTTWHWVADELRHLGHEVAVPSIDPVTLTQGWRAVAQGLASQLFDFNQAVFVAHSGAGLLLPTIVQLSRAVDPTLLFVDSTVPPADGNCELLPAGMIERLRPTSVDGVLPPWSQWFGDGVMESLVPDGSRRSLVEGELPRLRIDYFTSVITPTTPWPASRNGYLRLSEGYARAASDARRRGWPVRELEGGHLDIVTRPTVVVDAIRALLLEVAA